MSDNQQIPEESIEYFELLNDIPAVLRASNNILEDCADVAFILAEAKRQGITRTTVHPSLREAYFNAAKILKEIHPEFGNTLSEYDPIGIFDELLRVAKKNPFTLAALELTERDALLKEADYRHRHDNELFGKLDKATIDVALGIGQFIPLERIKYLKNVAISVNEELFLNSYNEYIWRSAWKEGADISTKSNLAQLVCDIHFRVLGINETVKINLKQGDSSGSQAAYRYDKDRHIHEIDIWNITTLHPLEIIIAIGHESIHAWQAYIKTIPGYKLPSITKIGCLNFSKHKSSINSTTPRSSSEISDTHFISNSSLVSVVLGDASHYVKLAKEREAYGYEFLLLGKYLEAIIHEPSLSAEAYATATEYLSVDLNKHLYTNNGNEIRTLLSQLDFKLPGRTNPIIERPMVSLAL